MKWRAVLPLNVADKRVKLGVYITSPSYPSILSQSRSPTPLYILVLQCLSLSSLDFLPPTRSLPLHLSYSQPLSLPLFPFYHSLFSPSITPSSSSSPSPLTVSADNYRCVLFDRFLPSRLYFSHVIMDDQLRSSNFIQL